MRFLQKITSIFLALQFMWVQTVLAVPTELEPLYNDLKAINAQKKELVQIWSEIRPMYSKEDRALLDAWVLLKKNSKEKTADIQASLVKLPTGQKALRATFDFKGKSTYYEFSSSLVDDQILINKKSLKEMQSTNLKSFIQNLAQNQAYDQVKLSETIQILDQQTLSLMTDEQRAIYFIQQRLLLETAQKILQKNKKVSLWNLLFSNAVAADGAKSCFNQLGYVTQLNSSGQCPNDIVASKQFSQIQCELGTQLCNPQYYGLNRIGNGSGLCLSVSDLASQKTCGDLSPLKTAEDVKKLMTSLMTVKPDFAQKETGQKPQRPEEFLQQALAACEDSGLKASNSCTELMERKVTMNSLMVDMKGQGRPEQRPDRQTDRSDEKVVRSRPNESSVSLLSSISRKTSSSENCGIFCSIGTWLTSDIAIKSFLTLAGVVTGYLVAKNKYKKSSSASTVTSSTGTSTLGTIIYGSPTTPTGPDYSGFVQ